ncbi:hypothetical protein [Oceaniglobus ichthyenteri]|uniref:hypothetical protein n=1 Tax=Oceaniglobus ichthyenteri TaxID=2136177 RepID=UPI000D363056|nr:hypothetical protein [Oceaniglobus ichthyenteri]
MTGPITIPANEHGIVRLFALPYKLAMEVNHGETLAPLAKALGVAELDAEHVQIVNPAQLGEMGLTALLGDGHGIAPETLGPERARLNALSGEVAIVRSRAFGGAARTLALKDGCTLIAAFSEQGAPPPHLTPLTSTSAKGTLNDGGQGAGDEIGHRASRRTLLIAVLAAALLGLIVLMLTGQS